jgi:hypothetical protein
MEENPEEEMPVEGDPVACIWQNKANTVTLWRFGDTQDAAILQGTVWGPRTGYYTLVQYLRREFVTSGDMDLNDCIEAMPFISFPVCDPDA